MSDTVFHGFVAFTTGKVGTARFDVINASSQRRFRVRVVQVRELDLATFAKEQATNITAHLTAQPLPACFPRRLENHRTPSHRHPADRATLHYSGSSQEACQKSDRSKDIPFDTSIDIGATACEPISFRKSMPFDSSSSQPIHVRPAHAFLLFLVFWPDGLYPFSR